MIPVFTTLTFFVLWATDVQSQSVLITQWPHYISSLPSGLAEMHCYQNNTDYEYLYWYRQLRGKSFQLIVSILVGNANYEEGFKSGFQAVKSKEKQWSLTITSVQEKDEAVYLCAASLHNEAYFGKGTKLTVLEPDHAVTKPKVTVLPPSQKECRNPKNKEREKTIVCVASEFYPDHVSVSWTINGSIVREGVATDNAALRVGKYYRITSRLRVAAETWYNPSIKFTCIVTFYNVTNTDYPAHIFGETAVGDGMTRDKYLRITQTAKLSYGVFIIKSCIYGAFVSFLVWKLQGSAGKQHN
ncbi:M1-specific T cell receptor beta chain-like [Siniperca chuatsi]|uniref:M1-specific T cell receptor beta chain-like n=1 Tax=Siniperca chuatsi TaxID=119488 RepID=UPI001CE09906|nr:M1-specific T cell receptor beta chain-like [Siniperca chuatsi]